MNVSYLKPQWNPSIIWCVFVFGGACILETIHSEMVGTDWLMGWWWWCLIVESWCWQWLTNDDDDDACWLNPDVMIDELMMIMRCSVMWILSFILHKYMIFERYILYMMVFDYVLIVKFYIVLVYLFLVCLHLHFCTCGLCLLWSHIWLTWGANG